jgi:glycosyltransferase involved in cell wall biosynthesis
VTDAARVPRVSVCLLTYNGAKTLRASFDSLLAQRLEDFELVVNDDCSTDDTGELCRSYARRDPRVRYFRNPRNLTFAGNQNAAILRARSDHVALVHQGDVYRSDMLEKWDAALDAHPTAAIVFNSQEQSDLHGNVEVVHRHPYPPLMRGLTLFDEMIRRPSSPIFGITMVRKRHVVEAGPFDPRLPVLADVDMWLRLLLKHDVAYVPEPLVRAAARDLHYRPHSTYFSIRREHEVIYALNTARRYPGEPAKVAQLRREITPMIWKLRLEALAYCAWHRNWRLVSEGLALLAGHADFAGGDLPDVVHDWRAAAERAGEPLDRLASPPFSPAAGQATG